MLNSSTILLQSVRGVFTNPNCEYGANFIAINTLAQWSKCKVDGTASFYRSGNVSDAVTADIRCARFVKNSTRT